MSDLIKAGQRLKKRIEEELGLNQSLVAERTNWTISQPWVSGVLRGKFDPRTLQSDKLQAFLKAIQWTPEQFARETGLELPAILGSPLPEGYEIWPVFEASAAIQQVKPRASATAVYPTQRIKEKGASPKGVQFLTVNLECSAAEGLCPLEPGDTVGLAPEATPDTPSLGYWQKQNVLVVFDGESKNSIKLTGGTTVGQRQIKTLGYVVAVIR